MTERGDRETGAHVTSPDLFEGLMTINEASGFKVGQKVRLLVPCIGEDHEGTEHTLPAGSIGIIDRIDRFSAPQGLAFTIWIPVDDPVEGRGIVNVFDEADGPTAQFFQLEQTQ